MRSKDPDILQIKFVFHFEYIQISIPLIPTMIPGILSFVQISRYQRLDYFYNLLYKQISLLIKPAKSRLERRCANMDLLPLPDLSSQIPAIFHRFFANLAPGWLRNVQCRVNISLSIFMVSDKGCFNLFVPHLLAFSAEEVHGPVCVDWANRC